MDNVVQHFIHQPVLAGAAVVSLVAVLVSIPYFLKQQKRYGSLLEFASQTRKVITGVAFIALIGALAYSLTPYQAPAASEVALVLGDTQNTPAPKLSTEITDQLENTMLQHQGESVDALADSIKVVSAVKHPDVIALDAEELKLREIGKNSSNAKRSAEMNLQALSEKIKNLAPTDNGANYLEAILEARNNIKEGASIVVIGSGLSDYGDINFSQSKLLTNEQARKDTIAEIKKKYGHNYLNNYKVVFYGLGDTAAPQEPLSNKQKEIVRSFYKEVIRGMGGEVETDTKTLTGDPVSTKYIVGTTDTGCGDIGLIFDDENLKFISNQAAFADAVAAKTTLSSIKNIWDTYTDTIQLIQVDGYIAHYAGSDNLSQQRAERIKKALVELGIPQDKINATGRGFGPYSQDAQNRMVKVTINRDNAQCSD